MQKRSDRQWFSLREAAEFLNLTTTDVVELAWDGQLRPVVVIMDRASPVAVELLFFDPFEGSVPVSVGGTMLDPSKHAKSELETATGTPPFTRLYLNLSTVIELKRGETAEEEIAHRRMPAGDSRMQSEFSAWLIDPPWAGALTYAEIKPRKSWSGDGIKGYGQGPVQIETAEGEAVTLLREDGSPVADILFLCPRFPLMFDADELKRYKPPAIVDSDDYSETILALFGAAMLRELESLSVKDAGKLTHGGTWAAGKIATRLVGPKRKPGAVIPPSPSGGYQAGLSHDNARKIISLALRAVDHRRKHPT